MVHDLFNSEGIQRLEGVPENASDLYFSEKNFTFDTDGLEGKVIRYQTSNPIRQEGMKTWFSDLNADWDNNLLTGYLNIGVSVGELYNAKLTVD